MKKLLSRSFIFIFIILLTFLLLFLFTTVGLGAQFQESYNYVINNKYNYLITEKEPKIIIISGSSGAFGINAKQIEDGVGYKCANISLHADFGMKFQTEISKGNISKDDIVVISYEIVHWNNSHYSAELIMTAIDNNIQLYKYVPTEEYVDIIRYFPTYLFKKLDLAMKPKSKEQNGVYRSSAFDENGNMIMERLECKLNEVVDKEIYGEIVMNDQVVSEEMINYVNEFNDYVNSKGATLLISFPPMLDEAVTSSKDDIAKFQAYLEENIDAPIISNPNDYILEREYFYDTIYHLNSKGEKLRSDILIRDINNYLNQHIN
jgi:hypothetical protein